MNAISLPCLVLLDTTEYRLVYKGSSSPLLDLDSVSPTREVTAETRPQTPVVEVAQVALEGRIDELLVVLFQQQVC
jgi:hypothetical protein